MKKNAFIMSSCQRGGADVEKEALEEHTGHSFKSHCVDFLTRRHQAFLSWANE